MRIPRLATILCPLAAGLAALAGPTRALEPAGPGPVRIGMLNSMFKDVKPAMFNALAKPFYSLVESQTGLKSELLLVPTPDDMRQQLDAGKLQFGVFHGFEYAWMRLKQPALQPLMIAAPQHRPLRAYVVVHTTSTATGLADLKGQALAVPKGNREHARLFLARSCEALGTPPEAFFGQMTVAKTAEDALHDVADAETVQAAVVDVAGLQCFKERNPGRFKRLKVLVTSEVFPESVVVFREGGLDGDVVRRFRDGMAAANTTPLGRQLLSLWTMTGFEPIPPGYQQALEGILRTYPPPGAPLK
jgi:ABC-type phosphate/phosphonate transport system substrate-binding protein